MANLIPTPRILILIVLGLLPLLWFGTRMQTDPLWARAENIVHAPPPLIAEVPDSLQYLYCQMHGLPFIRGTKKGLELASYPSASNIEWYEFRKLTWKAFKQRFTVVSGVTSTGLTKQSQRAANLIAGDPIRVLKVDCSPQFDVELHKRYIGERKEGVFQKGELLEFWERCHAEPWNNFVAVIDNFDKINPETFFGPALWEALSNKDKVADFEDIEVRVPSNFYLISVTHLGPGGYYEFNEEHFKRLGRLHVLPTNGGELYSILRRQLMDEKLDSVSAAAVADADNMRKYIYYFLKVNDLLKEKYQNEGHQIGQGSKVKELFKPSDREALKQVFLDHNLALKPEKPLTKGDLGKIDFAADHEGLMPGSSFIAQNLEFLKQSGYFVEITMVGGTALLTALVGWWIFRRRERLIRKYGEEVQNLYAEFEKQSSTADAAARRLEQIKNELDDLVIRRKLNYTEGLYFLSFIDDKVKRIEFTRNMSENFLELFNTFMEDNVLTDSEYQKLKQFLQSIRHKIPEEAYVRFAGKVEKAYAANRFRL